MKSIIIRTLGGRKIGYGHFYRCLSLAKAIYYTDCNISILFLINEELEQFVETSAFKYLVSSNLDADIRILDDIPCDLFIFDSYIGSNRYLLDIKAKTRLMLIDDNNDIYDSRIPDIIYNGNIHAEKLNYIHISDQLQLLGLKYLIMKEEYWGDDTSDLQRKDGILITTGGTDNNGITLKILNSIKSIGCNIRVIIGPGYRDEYVQRLKDINSRNIELIYKPDSLREYLNKSKVAITSAGSTVYEVLSQKTTPIIFSMADNQDLICSEMVKKGVEYLGKYPELQYSDIYNIVQKRINKQKVYIDLWDQIDALGAKRVARELIGY